MKSRASRYLTFCVALLALCSYAFAQTAPADEPPASVAGKWIIYAKGPTGMTGTKSIELKQDGNTLSGHFKGPYQSGGLEGTIEQRHIVFHTKTRNVLTFRGRVEGERVNGVIQATSISGTFHANKGTGTWQAVRAESASSSSPE